MYRAGTLAEFIRQPEFAPEMKEVPKEDETLYHPDEYQEQRLRLGNGDRP